MEGPNGVSSHKYQENISLFSHEIVQNRLSLENNVFHLKIHNK